MAPSAPVGCARRRRRDWLSLWKSSSFPPPLPPFLPVSGSNCVCSRPAGSRGVGRPSSGASAGCCLPRPSRRPYPEPWPRRRVDDGLPDRTLPHLRRGSRRGRGGRRRPVRLDPRRCTVSVERTRAGSSHAVEYVELPGGHHDFDPAQDVRTRLAPPWPVCKMLANRSPHSCRG